MNLDLLCIADTSGRFLKTNQAWSEVLGYSSQQLEQQIFLDFVHPEDLPATREALRQLEAGQEVLNFTNRYRSADGGYRYIEWRSRPHGTRIYAAARDITRHVERDWDASDRWKFQHTAAGVAADFAAVQTPEALEAAFSLALQQVGESVAVDACYVLKSSSPGIFTETQSWHRDGSTKRHPAPLTGTAGELSWLLDRLGSTGIVQISDLEQLPPAASGEYRWWQSRGVRSSLILPLRTPESGLFGMLMFEHSRVSQTWSEEQLSMLQMLAGIMSATCDRLAARTQLQQSEQRIQTILNSMDDLVFVLDDNLVFRKIHISSAAQLVMAPEDFLDQPFAGIDFPGLPAQPCCRRCDNAWNRGRVSRPGMNSF
ncbi:PAS domain-containing protein [Spirochaeta africana]|uniref:PAS domain S-box n=1 Tax=Spirochaeta africana (strain ATCC 700263 / DSM 8902 / Z-7692) TaxID=889378 RepID=H9UHD9_SPIAZ|nr:PAS domain-containing protein [Spirochaeta africana]AFG36932.1 PAS domain S-box [Spirochaeta africana DSM 8902]